MNGKIGLSAVKSVEVEFLTERGSVYHQNVHTHTTRPVKEMHMKKRNVMNSVVQVTIIVINYNTKFKQEIITQQKNHTGVNGRTGVCVARSVEVEFHTERGNVINLNVPIPIIKNVMEVIMKKRSAMKNVVQVCNN